MMTTFTIDLHVQKSVRPAFSWLQNGNIFLTAVEVTKSKVARYLC